MKPNVKHSLGNFHINQGTSNVYNDEPYVLDLTRMFYVFDVVPMGAVRMTKSDVWKTDPNHPDPKQRQRISVTRYFAMKKLIALQANLMKYTLGKQLDIVFLIPMPDSWGKKKKEQMNKMRHEVQPDFDNLVKGFCDALSKNDQDISEAKIEKRWAYRGSIIVFP